MGNVFSDVKKYTDYYALKWEKIKLEATALNKINRCQRKLKEKELKKGITKIFRYFEDFPTNQSDREARIEKLKKEVKYQAKNNLNISKAEFEKIMFDGIMDVTEKFIAQAREFDPKIKPIDIMQAMRNVWIMNLIQIIAGRKIEYTSSIFAYSMLYPYTDNYIDDPSITSLQKEEFNMRLSKRLGGEKILPSNDNEKKIYSLVKMIEEQYPRKEYKEVFDSILAIHKGQIKSLEQQESRFDKQRDVLKISAEKGGTSVLADAYLVCGKLSDELFEFSFGFGFLLQLIDDLQDVDNDIINNHATLFSQYAGKKMLDEKANKLIAFVKGGIDYEKASDSPYINEVESLIVDNCILMIMEAISTNKKYFTNKYLRFMKYRSELSFSFFKRTNKMLKRKMKLLYEVDIF